MQFGIEALIDGEGFTLEEWLEKYALESIVPGICTECGAISATEPDQQKGWCEECDKGKVKSGLILLGFI